MFRFSSRTLLVVLAIIVLGILSGFCIGCRPAERTHFDVANWQGELLNGKEVRFAGLAAGGVILNVYSPTCVPCIEELPALDRLFEIAREKDLAMYIVADGRPEAHGMDIESNAAPEEARAALLARLNADVTRYKIRIPLVVMDAKFRVAPRDGLVSGTPETLLFRTNPFVLEYNFVGPVAGTNKPAEFEADSRFQFVVKKVLALADAGRTARVGLEDGGYDDP